MAIAVAVAALMVATTVAVAGTKKTAARAMVGDTDNNKLKGAVELASKSLLLLSPSLFPLQLLFLSSPF
jgi:hypothetical protein